MVSSCVMDYSEGIVFGPTRLKGPDGVNFRAPEACPDADSDRKVGDACVQIDPDEDMASKFRGSVRGEFQIWIFGREGQVRTISTKGAVMEAMDFYIGVSSKCQKGSWRFAMDRSRHQNICRI